jgi:uracil phosphoribosyltransferase
MLASGSSMEMVYQALLKRGTPAHIHVASILASKQGVKYVKEHFPENTTIWTAAIDPILNDHSYIVPGLGDAGDLAFGEKI